MGGDLVMVEDIVVSIGMPISGQKQRQHVLYMLTSRTICK